MSDAESMDHALPAGPIVTVHLLRHGLVHNPKEILYGRLPGYQLSHIGRAMALRLADYFAGSDITHLAASPLIRAQQTAEPIADALGLDIVTDTRLLESENKFEGTKFAVGDGVLKRPANWPKVRDPFTPSWGEPYLQIAHRMLGAVYAGVAGATDAAGIGHEAVLVSHQLPIWTVRRFLEGRRLWHNPAKRQCGLASLTSLTFTGGVLTALRYGEPAADLVPGSAASSKGA